MRFLLMVLLLAASRQAAEVARRDIFVGGTGGYAAYRIPSLLATKAGTLLAFCEGRKDGKGDSGNIDLVMKRSSDGGKSWSSLKVLWDDGDNSCGNPCPVLDEETGTISLLMTHNLGSDTGKAIQSNTARSTRTVWISRGGDDGQNWSAPVEITRDVKKPE